MLGQRRRVGRNCPSYSLLPPFDSYRRFSCAGVKTIETLAVFSGNVEL